MKVLVFQLIGLTENKVSKEQNEIRTVRVNAFDDVRVIGSDKRIPEIPGVFGKSIVGNVEAQRGRSRVSFFKSVDLP